MSMRYRTFRCLLCGAPLEEEDVVWVDPKTGEGTQKQKGVACCENCAMNITLDEKGVVV